MRQDTTTSEAKLVQDTFKQVMKIHNSEQFDHKQLVNSSMVSCVLQLVILYNLIIF